MARGKKKAGRRTVARKVDPAVTAAQEAQRVADDARRVADEAQALADKAKEASSGTRARIPDGPATDLAVAQGSSNEDLMKQLLADGVSEADILAIFSKRYAVQGKDDPTFVASRVHVYKRIAEKDPQVVRAVRRRSKAQ